MAEYRIIYQPGEGYYEEKHSRFLARACPIGSEEEALSIVAAARKEFWEYKHHCYAFTLGKRGELCRSNDDGEPSGTAGAPILEVIKGSEVRNLLVVVNRYWGGILLGTGGLVRAYSSAARDALEHAQLLTVREGEEWRLICDYSDLNRLDQAVARLGVTQGPREFGSDVTTLYYPTAETRDGLLRAAEDVSAGSVIYEKLREVSFSELNGKILFF